MKTLREYDTAEKKLAVLLGSSIKDVHISSRNWRNLMWSVFNTAIVLGALWALHGVFKP